VASDCRSIAANKNLFASIVAYLCLTLSLSLMIKKLVLASRSPRRQELLRQIGVPFDCVDNQVEEARYNDESPSNYVLRLAKEKALTAASLLPARPVLGADTIVVAAAEVLEKPLNEAHAIDMLMTLSGTTHQVLSAVAIACDAQVDVRLSSTNVTFRTLSIEQCRQYWHTGEPQDKAGAYGIQGLGAVFVNRIEGSYTGVVGLPIEETVVLLKHADLLWWQTEENV